MMEALDEAITALSSHLVSIAEIRTAAAYLAGRIHRTPLLSATGLGTRVGVRLWLKAESLQRTASFLSEGLKAGRAVRLNNVEMIADGLTAPAAGTLTLEHVRALVDEVVVLTDETVRDAVIAMLERGKLMIEPAGATALAAVLEGKIGCRPGDSVVAIASGGNIELQRLRSLIAGTTS